MSNKLVTNRSTCKKLHHVYTVSQSKSPELYAEVIANSILLPSHSFITLIDNEGVSTVRVTLNSVTWQFALEIGSSAPQMLYGAFLVEMDGIKTEFPIPHGMATIPTSFAVSYSNVSGAAVDIFVKEK